MSNLFDTIIHMNDLDDFAMGDSFIHRFHPLCKIILCIILLITILTSNLLELLILLVMILLLSKIAGISYATLVKRGMLGLPFSLCIGLSNILLNHHLIEFYGLHITYGMYSCILILFKTFECLCVTYILISTTSFTLISSELIRIKVPSFFVLVLTMTYRYIFTLLEEANTMTKAYILRNPTTKAILMKDMGSFVGSLLIKTMQQSSRVYQCMLCRGFDVKKTYTKTTPINYEHIYISMMFVGVIILMKGVF